MDFYTSNIPGKIHLDLKNEKINIFNLQIKNMKKSSINWCESDYEITPYIAEFWNTISMIPCIILALKGLCNKNSLLIIRIGFFLSFITAIGSVTFHATLTNWGQTLDELSMLYFGIWGLYLT